MIDSPLAGSGLHLTDGGLETELVFHDGVELPAFAAFTMLYREGGRAHLARYYERFLATAEALDLGFVLEAPTWRANPAWIETAGFASGDLQRVNADSVGLMHELRERWTRPGRSLVVSGCLGPRGDGYVPGELMTAADAEAYHATQIHVLAGLGVDVVSAFTITNAPEAVGIVRAAGEAGVPVVVSFTVETDGRLPTGQALGDAISEVDRETAGQAAWFMVNCAHPTHFSDVLRDGAGWLGRIGGLRTNASCRSHAELDASETLDDGDPEALGRETAELKALLPGLRVIGGCCGTDHRHVEQMALRCAA